MKIRVWQQSRGVALIIVMIVIVVLGILAGGFAYSMKVETKLAQNTSFEGDLEWMGRSGVEFARYILFQHLNVFAEPWESLNQKWAGGPLGTNEVLVQLSLDNNVLGPGSFSVRITDLERKYNINMANEDVLQQALAVVGVEPVSITVVRDSFLDWLDSDEDTHLSGTESRDYMSSPNEGYPPYMAKNGPIDDVSELLLIRGITQEMYWGTAGRRKSIEFNSLANQSGSEGLTRTDAGLVNMFTAISSGFVNINTAPVSVLQLVTGIDIGFAQGIVAARAGWDGVEGTEDDVPFRTPGELINVPGMNPVIVQQLQGRLATRSLTFEVAIEAKVGQYARYFTAIIRRNPGNIRDQQVLCFRWR
jgi:general secretion pathway protein K